MPDIVLDDADQNCVDVDTVVRRQPLLPVSRTNQETTGIVRLDGVRDDFPVSRMAKCDVTGLAGEPHVSLLAERGVDQDEQEEAEPSRQRDHGDAA